MRHDSANEIRPVMQHNAAALRLADDTRGRGDVQRLRQLFLS